MPPESQNSFPPVNSPVQGEPSRKHPRLILLIITMILVSVLAVIYFWYKNEQSRMDKFIPDDRGLETQNFAVTTTTNQFTDWKTYKNEAYRFEFKYPSDWILEADENGVSLDSPENFKNPNRRIEILVAYDKNPNNLSAKQYYNGTNGIKAFDNPTEDKELIIENQKSYELYPATGEFPGELVIIPKEQIFIRFDTALIKENTGIVLNQILSTFKISDINQKKIYRNDKYGFEFAYPSDARISTSTNGVLITGSQDEGEFDSVTLNFYDFNSFKSTLNNGAFEEELVYDIADNQWEVKHSSNLSASDAFCPYERTTSQKLPYYQIGDFRTGRLWNFAFVTTNGIIVLSEVDGYIPSGVNPADIKFDNAKDVLSVGCIIGVNFKDWQN